MKDSKANNDKKQLELHKYRDLVLATNDYYLENNELHFKTADFDSIEHYQGLKTKTEEDFKKGRLSRLKQWFRDLSEMQVETGDLRFNKYLQDKTKYDIDIFDSYFQRVDKIIEKGKITSDNQFQEISLKVNQLCQADPIDNDRIEKLNSLLGNYEQEKSRRIKKPTA
jgi:hypothetical protein